MRLIDADACPALFDEEFKETRHLILQGETHLDNLAEGFSEAAGVIRVMPTIDPESLRPKGRVVLKERHRGGFQVVTGVDECGNRHTVQVDTRSVGKEPYCSECGAALAESFQDYCPRCGAKMEETV